MLRSLRVERADIRAAMLFALDHANCASEIADVLVVSLTLPETAPHLKISRHAPFCARFLLRRSPVCTAVVSPHRKSSW